MLLDHFRIVELTHALSSDIPTWDGSCGYCQEITKDYDKLFRVQHMQMQAGVGTHMDAPSHRFQGASCISHIPLQQLIVPACVIDLSSKAYADYEVSVDDIETYEREHAKIPPHALVIAYTGWSRFWSIPAAYRNVDAKGQMHHPAFSNEAAQLLLTRDIAGIAIDTLSPDCLDAAFSVHTTILGAGKYIIENVADCSEVPSYGAYVIALPLYAEGATEAPLRMVALIPS